MRQQNCPTEFESNTITSLAIRETTASYDLPRLEVDDKQLGGIISGDDGTVTAAVVKGSVGDRWNAHHRSDRSTRSVSNPNGGVVGEHHPIAPCTDRYKLMLKPDVVVRHRERQRLHEASDQGPLLFASPVCHQGPGLREQSQCLHVEQKSGCGIASLSPSVSSIARSATRWLSHRV